MHQNINNTFFIKLILKKYNQNYGFYTEENVFKLIYDGLGHSVKDIFRIPSFAVYKLEKHQDSNNTFVLKLILTKSNKNYGFYTEDKVYK